tara:strand:+ start:897 stop:1118 length:222 start_codon:yes stop_codon:yes gene_type:complete
MEMDREKYRSRVEGWEAAGVSMPTDFEEAAARALVEILEGDEMDDWTYKAIRQASETWHVEVYDDDGYYCGKM